MKGYTLIELLVAIGIMSVLVGGLLAGFNTYNENQRTKQAALTLKTNLRLAQARALGAQKPTSGCTELIGITVSFSATTYSIQAQCTEGLVGEKLDFTLPVGVSLTSVPSPFTFGVLTRGITTTSSITISLSGPGKRYAIAVSPDGDINDLGYQ